MHGRGFEWWMLPPLVMIAVPTLAVFVVIGVIVFGV